MPLTPERFEGIFPLMWTLLVSVALACLWDSDTLAVELAGLPGVEQVVYGDVDRMPPAYYRHRRDRVAALIDAGTATAADHDDGAVAADRLGDHDQAIAWMQAKRALPGLTDDDRYRTEANQGTFHAHRWLSGGADRSDLTDLDQALAYLDAALALNPDAHFGREQVQRDLIAWVRDPPEGDHPISYLQATRRDDLKMGDDNLDHLHDVVEGLRGLVVLGAAWESVDVMHALARALEGEGRNSAAMLASLRAQELAIDGKRSLQPGTPTGEDLARRLRAGIGVRGEDHLEEMFAEGRAMADLRNADRTRAIQAKLDAGQHPDTHPGFWDDALPQVRPVPELPSKATSSGCACATSSLSVGGLPLGLALLMRRRRNTPS